MSRYFGIPIRNGVALGLGSTAALAAIPNTGAPTLPPGQLDFSKARNSGLLVLKVP